MQAHGALEEAARPGGGRRDGDAVTKHGLRRLIEAKRLERSARELARLSEAAQRNVLASDAIRAGATVCCYLALPGEVLTDALLAGLWSGGKTVCVTAFERETRLYRPARLMPGDALEVRRFGVREPARAQWMPWDAVDVVVAPGLAFDTEGHRLGHGAGHYDRLLTRMAEAREGAGVMKIGLAFEFQVLERVPATEHDVMMNQVVTEARCVVCGPTRE